MNKTYILLILMLGVFLKVSAQEVPKGWLRIYYVLDQKTQVAKRFCNDSTWVVDNPTKALESMYQEKRKAETKYELALAILKLINPNGTPTDQKKYNEAVFSYNTFLQKNH